MMKRMAKEVAPPGKVEDTECQRYHKSASANEILQLDISQEADQEGDKQAYKLEDKDKPGITLHLKLISVSAYKQGNDNIIQGTY